MTISIIWLVFFLFHYVSCQFSNSIWELIFLLSRIISFWSAACFWRLWIYFYSNRTIWCHPAITTSIWKQHIWFLNIFWCIISTSIWGFKNIAFGTSSTPFGTSSTPALGATGTPSFSFGSTQIGHSSAFGSSSPFGSTASPLGGQSSAFGEFKNH